METGKVKKIRVIQTAKDTDDRLAQKTDILFQMDDIDCENNLINIYRDITYQEMEGFGGAFTEAGAVTLDKLSPLLRKEVLNAYFNPASGLGYSLCRTHINSCDFSLGNYAYVETEDDTELETFNIDRDKKSLIPFIKDALEIEGAKFKLLASPWSPPGWMKTTGKMNLGGKLKEEYEETWAKYILMYIKKYANEGIQIWGVTVQNEPKAVQTWDSCVYTAEEEKDFVKHYLGPVLEREGLSDIKIIAWDHNKERVFERAKVIFSDPEASKYIWGMGFHWYSGDHFEGLAATHEIYPDKKLIFTEGCQEGGVKLGSWDVGERYGHDIIGDLNNWTCAWVDWNMLLDETGGPNHVCNYCDAPIIADTQAGTIHYQSSYYYIGHFSKFIRQGAKRIGHSKFTEKLEVSSFINTNGEIVVVVMNRTDKEVSFKLRDYYGTAEAVSLPHSVMTLIY